MFHIKFPKFRGFFTWDELGCLARGLGFPVELFKDNLGDVIEPEEHGLTLKEVYKMLDYRLLEGALHRTQNQHTAEWNMKAVRKSLTLSNHRAISFEELYNTRVAYQAYEAFDMKGMHLDQHTLLCTLRMCRRSIAPMKLAHRIKHMKGEFEEQGRIQLYEFLDLVLWCGVYESYCPDDIEVPDGKDRDLFVLVDFEKLLSHHDQRLADRLNAEYLQEEWDFGKENLGSRKMFKEPPVKCAEERVKTARAQKRHYRGLKSHVHTSQKNVYRAKAGFVRERPLTAPNLSMYAPKQPESEPPTFTAHNAYEIMQRKVKSARTRDGSAGVDTSDRPQYTKVEEVDRPRVISDDDLQDAKKKFELLEFDIATMEGRLKQGMEDIMETYHPGYRERELSKQEKVIEINLEPRPKSVETLRSGVSLESVNRLTYPDPCLPPTHARTCDARFRGWHETKTRAGGHFILASPSYENSYKGLLHQKMSKQSSVPVQHVKGDILYRRTKKSEVEKNLQGQRPSTAPPSLENTQKEKPAKKGISPTDSCKTVDTGYNSLGDSGPNLVINESFAKNDPSVDTILHGESSPMTEHWNRHGDMLRVHTMNALESSDDLQNIVLEQKELEDTYSRAINGSEKSPVEVIPDQTEDIATNSQDLKLGGQSPLKVKKKHLKERSWIAPDELAPVPVMEHSKPKTVPVGGIGNISLLESISESKYWEEVCDKEQVDDSTDEESSDTRSESSVDSGQGEDIELTLSLLKKRLHSYPLRQTSKSRKERMIEKFNKKVQQSNEVSEKLHKDQEVSMERRKLERPKSDSSWERKVNSHRKQYNLKSKNVLPHENVIGNKQSVFKGVIEDTIKNQSTAGRDNKENEFILSSDMVSPNSVRSEQSKSRGSVKSTSDYESLASSRYTSKTSDTDKKTLTSSVVRRGNPGLHKQPGAKTVKITLSKVSLKDNIDQSQGNKQKACQNKLFRLVKRVEGAISSETANRLLMTSQV